MGSIPGLQPVPPPVPESSVRKGLIYPPVHAWQRVRERKDER